MAKSGKKRKKAEKSKTKLRQSIKLPKGLNETNAQVTSKKINVLNQLRTQDGADENRLTKKKIGVRDLMSKLSNTGIATKLEGLEGLNELVKAYPEICQEELSQLLSSVIPINTHIETKLRSASRSLLSFILSNVDSSQILPLSPLITAHLCCGLSHIDSDIQLDSLKLLDIIMDSSQLVVIRGHEQILPNCLDQVSLNAKNNQQIQRSLHKNVSGKVSALQWRTQVLQRALKIVSLVIGKNETNSSSEPICGRKISQEFYSNLIIPYPTQNVMSLKEIVNNRYTNKKEETTTFNLDIFMKQVNDLLFQTWCEAIVIDKKKQDQNMISSSVLPTLNVIIDLLLASQSDIDDKFLDYIMNSFPLELLPMSNNTEKNEKSSINGLNLDICLLVLRQNSKENIDQVLDFIKGFKINDNQEATKLAKILSLVVKNDIQENVETLDSIIDQVITNYKNNEFVTEAMILMSTWSARNQIPSINGWISDLPNLLLSPRVNSCQIEAIRTLFKRKDTILFEAFKNLNSFPSNFPDTNSSLLDQVCRVLVLFPNLGIPKQELSCRLNELAVTGNTKTFVNNLCYGMDVECIE